MKAFAWLLSFSFMASGGKIINFDTGPVGKVPPGWTVAMTNRGGAPLWEIRPDHTAPTQPYVLAQISNDGTRNRFPLAILNGVTMRDGDVSVRIKPVAGKGEQAGGLVWRYRDENNYYLARANALENNVAVYKMENGQRIPLLAMVKHPIASNAWCILKVSLKGNRIQVYIDHRRILEARDGTFAGPGKVGLCTVGDSVTYFDDFRVYPK